MPYCDSICIAEFRNKGETVRYPTAEEIKVLTNVAHTFSDIAPIPSIPKIARNLNIDNFDDFIKYLSCSYDELKNMKKKRVLGYFPIVPPFFVDIIIDFYIDQGINGFYIDFDGTMVTSHLTTIAAIKKRLRERGYEEDHFLYYINVSYGKALNEKNVLSARDLLGFGHGLDGLGVNHLGPKRGENFFKWIKSQKNKGVILSNAIRLFNKEDYGYYQINSPNIDLEQIYPSDGIYSIDNLQSVTEYQLKKLTSVTNLQQLSLECMNLENLVDESPNETIEYFSSKEMIKRDDIKRLIKKY